MFLSKIIITTAVLTISHHCFADNVDIQPFLNKPYKLVSSDDNFDLILEKLNIDVPLRKELEQAKPTMTLTWNPTENIYSLRENTDKLNIEVLFQIGKGFINTTVDGRKVHELFQLHGTNLKETQKKHGSPKLVIERRFSTDHVVVKLHLKNIVSIRIYDAV